MERTCSYLDNDLDGIQLGHRNLSIQSEYDYHQAVAQHAAAVSAANNSSLHQAMGQIPMIHTGLNLSVNSPNQGIQSAMSPASHVNSNTAHHIQHASMGNMGNAGLGVMTCGGGGGKKNKKPKVNKDGIPAPKRATTAYINFTQWYREELKKTGRTIPKIGDFGKECAAKWNSLGEEDKQPFLDIAAKDRERYKKEMAIYKPAGDPDKPKRPGTAFMLFMSDFRKEMAGKEPEGGVAALAKLGGERWRNMTEEDKRPYVERQNEEKLRYEQNMEEYRRKQSVEGIPQVKQPRIEEPAHESSESYDSPSAASVQQPATPASGNSTPTPVSLPTSSPPPLSPSPTSVAVLSPNSTPTHTPSPTGNMPNLPSLSAPMSLSQAMAMGYTQHSISNFGHAGSVLAPTPNYNQAHPQTTMPTGTPYLPTGPAYSQSHLQGPYSWT